MLSADQISRTLLAFLAEPVERQRFDAVFALSLHVARAYLAGLGRRGFRLPLDEYAGRSALNDCTVDCLATLFVSAPGRPFYLVVDYLREHVGRGAVSVEVAARFQALIAGHIRQELHRLKTAADPQSANIRRRVRHLMRGEGYEEFEHGGQRSWAWRGARDGRRLEMPSVDDVLLHQAILDAVRHEHHMPDRCRRVFAALDVDDRCQNFVIAYRLLAAMVRVLGDHGDAGPVPLPSPREAFVRSRVQLLASQAVGEISTGEFGHLAAKRGIAEVEQSAYRLALNDLMADFVEDGDHDLLPQYLKERLPPKETERYLARHKYVWETTVAECKERLRELLRAEGLEP